jgi:hypothetical protein
MRSHAWDEKTWNTTLKGYRIGINPQHYTDEQASLIIQNDFKSKNVKAPPFRLVYTSPNTKYNDRKLRTKAYAIEVDFANSSAMNRALKTTYAGTNKYLMAKLRYSHPKAFVNAIKMQNSHLTQHYVIPMVNFNDEMMFYIRDIIKQQQGVQDIVFHQRRSYQGRYNIIVQKD